METKQDIHKGIGQEIVGTDDFRVNRWHLFGVIVLVAVLMTLYVNNVRRMDSLFTDVQKLKEKKKFLLDEGDVLLTRLNYLQSADRIINIAETKLNMKKIDEIPEVIINED